MSDNYIDKIISINLETIMKKEIVIGLASGTKIKAGIDTGEKMHSSFCQQKSIWK